MELFSMLAIDANSIVESGQAVWALLGTLSVTTIVSIFTAISTQVSKTKITKISDFSVLSSQIGKQIKDEFSVNSKNFLQDTKNNIVDPLLAQNKSLISDNQQLASLCVSLVALVPMPLDVKRTTMSALTTINSVSAEAKAVFEQSLLTQEQQEAQTVVENTELSENIGNI